MMPDIHQMKPYGLKFIHDEMKMYNELGFVYRFINKIKRG